MKEGWKTFAPKSAPSRPTHRKRETIRSYDPTPGASGNNYWLYASQSDAAPTVAAANATGDITNPGANVANYAAGADWGTPVQNGNFTTVGSAAANNYFGTADQGGNVWEWTDAISSTTQRVRRGGAWDGSESLLRASQRGRIFPTLEADSVWFRVASVPEPTSFLLTMLAGGAMLIRRKR